LTEHYAGAFPVWLSPVQARVVTVSEKNDAWAKEVEGRLVKQGFRVDSDLSSDKLGAKIRRAQLEKIPYMLVAGDRESESKLVAPRTREGTQLDPMGLDDFIAHLTERAAIPRAGVLQ
jgi:threonyl-tRNA synthetase